MYVDMLEMGLMVMTMSMVMRDAGDVTPIPSNEKETKAIINHCNDTSKIRLDATKCLHTKQGGVYQKK